MRHFFSACVVIITFAFSSCNFSEELTLKEDGSGRLAMKFDGSELLKMTGGTNSEESPGKTMDSIISFKELLESKKDSIAQLPPEEQERLMKLENFNLHMIMNEEAGDMKINMFTDFEKVTELSDVFSAFQNAGAFGNQQTKKSSFSTVDATETSYTFAKNKFTRTSKILDYELLQKNVDSLGKMELFLGSSTYKLVYHFPKPVKSVSKKGALYSEDRKTITIEVPFIDYMRDPEILNIEVELKK